MTDDLGSRRRKNSIPPTASRRWPLGGVSDEKSDPQCNDRGGVGVFFHEPSQEVVAGNRGPFDSFGTFHGGVDRLAVGVLHRIGGLVHQAIRLRSHVASSVSPALVCFCSQ